METDGCLEIFYAILKSANSDIPLVGDGDFSSFESVLAAVDAEYEVKKEDCIGHAQKRLGTALRVVIKINDRVQFHLMAKHRLLYTRTGKLT